MAYVHRLLHSGRLLRCRCVCRMPIVAMVGHKERTQVHADWYLRSKGIILARSDISTITATWLCRNNNHGPENIDVD
jgi:hypothetical protein